MPPDQVHRALAFDQFSNVFTMMMGPIAGGLLLDYIGLHGAYLVGASLNAVGATIALRLPTPPNNRPLVRTSIVSNLRDGFHYIRSQHFLIGVLAVTVIFNVFVWPFTTMVPVFGREQLGLSAGLIGALMAMLGAGSFIANLTLSVIRIQIVAQAYFFGTLIGTIGILALPWMTTFESALVVMLFTGIGVGCFSSNQGATMFLNASPQYRSQAMGFLTMAIGVGPLGILHIGILAAIFGAPTAMIIMAIEGMIVIGIAFFVWPDFRRFPGRPLGPEGS